MTGREMAMNCPIIHATHAIPARVARDGARSAERVGAVAEKHGELRRGVCTGSVIPAGQTSDAAGAKMRVRQACEEVEEET